MLRLRDIMTQQVMTLEPQMTLREAMDILTSRHVSGAPVVSGQRVVGVISATDLLAFASTPREEVQLTESSLADKWDEPVEWDETGELLDGDDSSVYFNQLWDEHSEDTNDVIAAQGEPSSDALSNYLVEDVMTKTIRWLSPDADVRSAADMMREYGVHRVLVVNRGRLVGLVSAMDIAKAVAERKLPNRSFVFESNR